MSLLMIRRILKNCFVFWILSVKTYLLKLTIQVFLKLANVFAKWLVFTHQTTLRERLTFIFKHAINFPKCQLNFSPRMRCSVGKHCLSAGRIHWSPDRPANGIIGCRNCFSLELDYAECQVFHISAFHTSLATF